MADEHADRDDWTDDAELEDADESERISRDPARADRGEKYDDRHQEARESANPDDHRDEEPHD